MTYAKGTEVSPEKSRVEIEKLLTRMKASQHGVNFDNERGCAIVIFTVNKRVVSFTVAMPKRENFKKHRHGYYPAESKVDELWQQAIRERWRVLLMTLKGKFAAVESGIETFEQAFFYHLQVPGGGTVGEHVMPRYQAAMAEPGKPLLGAGS